MAISVTKAKVRPLPGAIVRRFTAKGTVTAGAPVYITTAGGVKEATANSATGARGLGVGVADMDGSTSFATNDAIDVVMFGPIAGYASIDEEKDVYIGGTNTELTLTAPTAGDVAGSTAYQWILGHGSDKTSVLFVHPRGWKVATATSS
jgi:hypothetical protein